MNTSPASTSPVQLEVGHAVLDGDLVVPRAPAGLVDEEPEAYGGRIDEIRSFTVAEKGAVQGMPPATIEPHSIYRRPGQPGIWISTHSMVHGNVAHALPLHTIYVDGSAIGRAAKDFWIRRQVGNKQAVFRIGDIKGVYGAGRIEHIASHPISAWDS